VESHPALQAAQPGFRVRRPLLRLPPAQAQAVQQPGFPRDGTIMDVTLTMLTAVSC